MKLRAGRSYSAANSVLVVTILEIHNFSENYTKAKISLTINGRLQERPKNWKLIHKQISHWIEV
jgi:hypothetical protein